MRLIKSNTLRHTLYEQKGGYLLLPVLIMLCMGILAGLLPWLETNVAMIGRWSHHTSWLVPGDPAMAQLLLGAIAGFCITIVSVLYSILLIALTFASIQFSPRILISFLKDRVSQTTLGVFIGTFSYCMLLLPSVRAGANASVPTLSVSVAVLLATSCLFYLIFFIHHIALAIQANYIIDRIANETQEILRSLFGSQLRGFPASDEPPAELPSARPIPSDKSGYVQFIDEVKLLKIAIASDVSVHITRSVGQFVPAGATCFKISPAIRASRVVVSACLNCFHIGPLRSMENDVEFGILQLVDIALKAISPAVNDPSTAICCIDQLSAILILATQLEPPSSRILDGNGTLRLLRRQATFPRMLEIAYDQIGPYGKSDMAVSLRLMRALHDISGMTNYPPYLSAIRKQAQRVAQSCSKTFAPEETQELFERLLVIETRSRTT